MTDALNRLHKPTNHADAPIIFARNPAFLKTAPRAKVSLDQWRIFHGVVNFGSFTQAAEHFHLSQSTVSYAIDKLQKQLGVRLLKTEGRKVEITAEGKALLERSKILLKEAVALEEYARSQQAHAITELRVAIEHEYAVSSLLSALRDISKIQPDIRFRIIETGAHAIEHALVDNMVDMAIGCQVPAGFVGHPLDAVEYVPVAHSTHPLCIMGREIHPLELAENLEIIIATHADINMSFSRGQRSSAELQSDCVVNNFDTALAAVHEGLGYAWLEKERVRQELNAGRLRIIPIKNARVRKKYFYLVHHPLEENPSRDLIGDILSRIDGKPAMTDKRNLGDRMSMFRA